MQHLFSAVLGWLGPIRAERYHTLPLPGGESASHQFEKPPTKTQSNHHRKLSKKPDHKLYEREAAAATKALSPGGCTSHR